ncbi:DNA-processing protein DprA [Sphingorhabdus arenilitoris]|uniref:DNA-processing protein DprA n=1 Tax=Sphingorhabdus arenilitoris TaxID=1490041 RepID=A0ABV8RFG8_9SPHN
MAQSTDFDRLRLLRCPNIGPVTYRQLLSRFGNAAEALKAIPDLAARGGKRSFSVASEAQIEAEMEAAHRAGARYVFMGDAAYPALLAQLDNAPPAFTYRGNLDLLDVMSVAMVGARNASAGACRYARQLALELGREHLVVVSGLARGIDTASHIGSLDSGTIAVIAGGIDVAYPPENKSLQYEIAEKGLLIAEAPPGTEPRARHFPYRNRIIAGLSLGTVVVEAAPRSGSLITARLAAEMGREVMAIPGSPLDPRARGCNQLIREGATLVQDASEIAELIRPFDDRMSQSRPAQKLEAPPAEEYNFEGEAERQAIIDLLGMTYVSVDELVRQSEAPTSAVQLVLLELELAGRLERGAGAKVRLAG